MARQIKIEQIGKFMNDQVEQLVRATTLEWEARVKVRTPVDTNRLRNGWQHSISGLSGEVQLSRLLGAVNIEQHKQRSLDSLTLLAKSLRVGLNRSTKKL
jgi:hypothetical protein